MGNTARELGFPELDTIPGTNIESDRISDTVEQNDVSSEVTGDQVNLDSDMVDTPVDPATEGPPGPVSRRHRTKYTCSPPYDS